MGLSLAQGGSRNHKLEVLLESSQQLQRGLAQNSVAFVLLQVVGWRTPLFEAFLTLLEGGQADGLKLPLFFLVVLLSLVEQLGNS